MIYNSVLRRGEQHHDPLYNKHTLELEGVDLIRFAKNFHIGRLQKVGSLKTARHRDGGLVRIGNKSRSPTVGWYNRCNAHNRP